MPGAVSRSTAGDGGILPHKHVVDVHGQSRTYEGAVVRVRERGQKSPATNVAGPRRVVLRNVQVVGAGVGAGAGAGAGVAAFFSVAWTRVSPSFNSSMNAVSPASPSRRLVSFMIRVYPPGRSLYRGASTLNSLPMTVSPWRFPLWAGSL